MNSKDIPVGEYEGCSFDNCTAIHTSLKAYKFIDCYFTNCDLSNSNINNASFQEIQFKGCKLLGIRWEECNPFLFQVSFDDCNLNHASFYGLQIPDTMFSNCKLNDVDFIEADLSGASFIGSDLMGCKFESTNLQKVNFRNSVHVVLNPESNTIQKAKFSHDQLAGLLTHYDIEIE